MATRAEFPPDTRAVRAARAFARDAVDAGTAASSDLELLVSEVVSNAVLHARTPFVVTVERRSDTVRVGVTDESPVAPVVKDHGRLAPTGRGLHILDALAQRWGVDTHDSGKTVWFEIDVPTAGEAP